MIQIILLFFSFVSNSISEQLDIANTEQNDVSLANSYVFDDKTLFIKEMDLFFNQLLLEEPSSCITDIPYFLSFSDEKEKLILRLTIMKKLLLIILEKEQISEKEDIELCEILIKYFNTIIKYRNIQFQQLRMASSDTSNVSKIMENIYEEMLCKHNTKGNKYKTRKCTNISID